MRQRAPAPPRRGRPDHADRRGAGRDHAAVHLRAGGRRARGAARAPRQEQRPVEAARRRGGAGDRPRAGRVHLADLVRVQGRARPGRADLELRDRARVRPARRSTTTRTGRRTWSAGSPPSTRPATSTPGRWTTRRRAFIDGQLRAIVGIELEITRIEAKAKLSQNRPEADVAGVIAGLRERGDAVSADAVGRARATTRGTPRRASSASPASRMTSRGAGLPVISSTWAAAWCSSIAKPLATAEPAAAAAAASGVGQGSYTASRRAVGGLAVSRIRS